MRLWPISGICAVRDLTLADVRLFTTLIRFDVAYHGIFKCDRRRIADYPHLSGYLRDLYQLPGIAETCDIDAVKRDYYGNLFPLNPGGIIPDWARVGTTERTAQQRKKFVVEALTESHRLVARLTADAKHRRKSV